MDDRIMYYSNPEVGVHRFYNSKKVLLVTAHSLALAHQLNTGFINDGFTMRAYKEE